MKEKSIKFTGPMILAILAGTKTQERRIVNQKKNPFFPGTNKVTGKFLYGERGDRLWVRESWRTNSIYDNDKPSLIPDSAPIEYFTNTNRGEMAGKSRPSIFMPRWASRIDLEITDVRVERLQDISESDAIAEGVESPDSGREEHDFSICPQCGGTRLYDGLGQNLGVMPDCDCFECDTHTKRYRHLWESINTPESWNANPCVWVVEFKRVVS